MAGTRTLATATDDQGRLVRLGYDYDDTPKVITVWCDNDSRQSCFAVFKAVDADGNPSATAVYGQQFPGKAADGDAPTRTVMVIDQSPANKQIPLRPSPLGNGKLTGIQVDVTFPG